MALGAQECAEGSKGGTRARHGRCKSMARIIIHHSSNNLSGDFMLACIGVDSMDRTCRFLSLIFSRTSRPGQIEFEPASDVFLDHGRHTHSELVHSEIKCNSETII
eukprot:3461920-Rhodomonas_salina.1